MRQQHSPRLLQLKEQKSREPVSFPGPHAFHPLQPVSSDFGLLFETKMKRKVECYRLVVPKGSNSNSFIETYQWRAKTSLPIVCTFYTSIIADRETSAVLEVFNEYCPHKLTQFKQISLNQVLYLLKEALYGYERLWQKFGPFIPTDGMIAINQSQKCKVWINQNFSLNTRPKALINEEEFLVALFRIFETRTIKTETSKTFFKEALMCKTFMKGFKLIDAVVNSERIKVPTKLDIQLLEGRKKLGLRTQMKSSCTHSFFKASEMSKVLSKDASHELIPNCYYSAYNPYPRGDRSINLIETKAKGTTLSQNLAKRRPIMKAEVSTPPISYKEIKRSNSPQTPMRKRKSTRVKGSLFRSGSIDAMFLGENQNLVESRGDGEDNQIIDFPILINGSLAESQVMTAEEFFSFDNPEKKLPARVPIYKKSTMDEEDEEGQRMMNFDPILLKNGWQRKVENLLGSETPMRFSIVEGKEKRADYSYIKLEKLDALGVNVVNSILPDDMDI